MAKNLRMAKAQFERRVQTRCPSCGSSRVQRETVVKNLTVTTVFQCAACGVTWPERRSARVA